MASIVELIDAFYKQELSARDYLAGLDRHQHFATRKLADVEQQSIVPEDQALWNSVLKPGLQAVYSGLLGAIAEAKAYADNRTEAGLQGVGALLVGVDQVMEILQTHTGSLSASTRLTLSEALEAPADGVSLTQPTHQGSAESTVDFLD